VKPDNSQEIHGFDRRAIPAGAIESHWTGDDGSRIRRFDWRVLAGVSRGSVLFMPGRSDFYEKYLESFDHWHHRGWNITSADWRGQAGSGRLGRDSTTGHIDDFATWVDDFARLWDDWRVSAKPPHVLVAHSMGGHIVLRALAEKRADPAATVVMAPLLGLLPGLGFVPVACLHRLVRFIASLGDPRRPAWWGSEHPARVPMGRMRRLTHDPDRHADEIWWWSARPELAMGPPSWGWIEAALRSCLLLRSPGFLERIDSPVLMLATSADRLVEFGAIEQAAARITGARLEDFGKEARHELLREEDPVRERVLQLIDAFLDSHAKTGV
jgi:lysophospholipase